MVAAVCGSGKAVWQGQPARKPSTIAIRMYVVKRLGLAPPRRHSASVSHQCPGTGGRMIVLPALGKRCAGMWRQKTGKDAYVNVNGAARNRLTRPTKDCSV